MADAQPKKPRKVKKTFAVFDSFEEENAAEHRRRASMSPEERCREFAVLQQRRWGERWTSVPIVKAATWETLDW